MSDDYLKLAERLNLNPFRVPKHDGEFTASFIEYLKLLYSPEEAAVVKYLSPLPAFTSTEDLAQRAGLEEKQIIDMLSSLLRRNRLTGMGNMFALPPIPILVNIHQFHRETGEDDLEAARLYLDFFIEKKFSRYYETSEKGTPVFRTIPWKRQSREEKKFYPMKRLNSIYAQWTTITSALFPAPAGAARKSWVFGNAKIPLIRNTA